MSFMRWSEPLLDTSSPNPSDGSGLGVGSSSNNGGNGGGGGSGSGSSNSNGNSGVSVGTPATTPTIKNHSVTYHDNHLYCFGGYDGRRNHMTLMIYSIHQRRWTTARAISGTPPPGRNGHTATLACRVGGSGSSSTYRRSNAYHDTSITTRTATTETSQLRHSSATSSNSPPRASTHDHLYPHHQDDDHQPQGPADFSPPDHSHLYHRNSHSPHHTHHTHHPQDSLLSTDPDAHHHHSQRNPEDPANSDEEQDQHQQQQDHDDDDDDEEEDQKIIIIGGWLGSGPLAASDTHVLDVSNGPTGLRWYQPPVRGTPPGPCNMHSADYVPQRREVFVFRGGNGREYLNDLHALHVRTYRWRRVETKGRPPQQRANHSSAVLEDRNELFIFGGWNGRERLNDVHVLHIDTCTWTTPRVGGELPHPRAGMTLTALRDRLYLFGGSGTSSKCFCDLQILDRKEMTWLDVYVDEDYVDDDPYGNPAGAVVVARGSSANGNAAMLYGNSPGVVGVGGGGGGKAMFGHHHSRHRSGSASSSSSLGRSRGGSGGGGGGAVGGVGMGRNPSSLFGPGGGGTRGSSSSTHHHHHHQRGSHASDNHEGKGTDVAGNMLSSSSFPSTMYGSGPTGSANPNDEDTSSAITVLGHGPGRRAGHTATAVNRFIYVFGGSCGSDYLNDFFVLDTDPPPTARICEPTSVQLLESRLSHYFNDAEFSDVTFLVEGRKVYGHRMVLSLVSDCFRAMFTTGFRESTMTEIEIPNCSYRSFLAMMEYIYTGRTPRLHILPFAGEDVSSGYGGGGGGGGGGWSSTGRLHHHNADDLLLGGGPSPDAVSQAAGGGTGGGRPANPDEDHDDLSFAVELLELADQFFLDHLKQVCEWMIQPAVRQHTYDSLLMVAQKTNALQLEKSCRHFARNMQEQHQQQMQHHHHHHHHHSSSHLQRQQRHPSSTSSSSSSSHHLWR